MSDRMPCYSLTFDLTVVDRKRLMRAALQQALADGLSAHEWREMRRDHGDGTAADIIMVMDKGSPFGVGLEINNSSAEAAT